MSLLAAAIGLGVLVAVMLPAADTSPSGPAGARVMRDTLVAFDDDGAELWRHRFEEGLSATYEIPRLRPIARDIDGDGRREVLFILAPRAANVSGRLVCFAADGTVRWEFKPGGAVRTETDTFEDIYSIGSVALAQPGANGARTIVVAGLHYVFYPTQITALSPAGEVLGHVDDAGSVTFTGATVRSELGSPTSRAARAHGFGVTLEPHPWLADRSGGSWREPPVREVYDGTLTSAAATWNASSRSAAGRSPNSSAHHERASRGRRQRMSARRAGAARRGAQARPLPDRGAG